MLKLLYLKVQTFNFNQKCVQLRISPLRKTPLDLLQSVRIGLNRSLHSISINKLMNNNTLDPDYVSGLTDGEGTFIVSITKKSESKIG